MSTPTPLFTSKHEKPQIGIFLSGSGTNAERVLEYLDGLSSCPLIVKALVTDAPETSRAKEIGERFGIPVVACDIRAFYAAHGEKRVSIATPRGQEVRKLWTDELRKLIAPYAFDFAIFAGFVPLTNLTEDFPCLNVHPGDLTYLEQGRRILVGLHTLPVERAILAGLPHLRSSVIVAQGYTGRGGEMDSGPVLGISGDVPIDMAGHTVDELLENQRRRPLVRPKGGFGDALESVAQANLSELKTHGDWVVLPKVVVDYAEGRYALDEQQNLYYRIGEKWHRINTVIHYENGQKEPMFV